jgi:hypothetical protein
MSDEPKASWTKAVPQLLGIAALTIVFAACLGDGPPVESPFRQASHRLRIGMSSKEADAVTRALGRPDHLYGSQVGGTHVSWIDEERGEVLRLHFRKKGHLSSGTAIKRLTEWSVESIDRP